MTTFIYMLHCNQLSVQFESVTLPNLKLKSLTVLEQRNEVSRTAGIWLGAIFHYLQHC